jgi:HD-like signal output (HDOD) protein
MAIPLTIRRLLTIQPVELPVFHPIAIKLQHLLENPDYTMDEVVELSNEDQSLAGQILKMANSTIYIGRVRTETIKDAVIRLGAEHVANLAMAASQAGLHVSENEVIHGFMQSLWLHSFSCAVGSRALARMAGCPQHAERAYMSGLLHDVGKLYLLKALERLNKAGVAHAALEESLLLEIFTELHVEQGGRLMQHWNMPKLYHNIVEHHEEPNFDTNDSVLTLVRTVNKACRAKGIGLTQEPALEMLEEPETALLQLSQADLEELYGVLEECAKVSLD